jgi:RNAse (barnase) inhibitor barstar
MAIFEDVPETFERLDWQILQNGWVSMYLKQSILDEDLDWFNKNGFRMIDLNCNSWTDEASAHQQLKRELNFPDYYGNNLNALNDCLSYIEIDSAGIIIVLRHIDTLDKEFAQSLVEIFASNSRGHMLFGNKLITLIQVDDPDFQIEETRSHLVLWNRKEWLNSSRGRYNSG